MSQEKILHNEIANPRNAAVDLASESNQGEFIASKRQLSPSLHPRLVCKVNFYPEQIILSQGNRDFVMTIDGKSLTALQKIFLMMDGTRSIRELQRQFFPQNPEAINSIVQDLDQRGLIDDATQVKVNSGLDTISKLEELNTKLFAKNAAHNLFWQQVASADSKIAVKVLSGWGLEYHHFLSQQCCFNSAILSFPDSTKIRQLINQLYCGEYGQDKIFFEAFNSLGISQEDLANTISLPQTTAICNALTFWANFEPIFFLTTVELIANQRLSNFKSCLQIGEQLKLGAAFLEPIKRLIDITLKPEPNNLTRRIFQEIPHLEYSIQQRLTGQTYLFWEMQDSFYRAIWDYYSSSPNLFRRIEVI